MIFEYVPLNDSTKPTIINLRAFVPVLIISPSRLKLNLIPDEYDDLLICAFFQERSTCIFK